MSLAFCEKVSTMSHLTNPNYSPNFLGNKSVKNDGDDEKANSNVDEAWEAGKENGSGGKKKSNNYGGLGLTWHDITVDKDD